jgi:hypothetical protein
MSRICSRIVGMRNRKHQLTTLGTAADAEPWPSRKFAVLPSRSQNLDCRFEDACSRLPWFEYHLCWAPRLDGSAGFVRMSLVQKQLEWFERTAFLGRNSSKRVQCGEPKIKTPGWIRTRSYSAYLPVTDIPTQPFAPALHCVFAANFGKADKPGVK